jgi:hypothetical protein
LAHGGDIEDGLAGGNALGECRLLDAAVAVGDAQRRAGDAGDRMEKHEAGAVHAGIATGGEFKRNGELAGRCTGAGEGSGKEIAADTEVAAVGEPVCALVEVFGGGHRGVGAPIGIADRIVDATQHFDAVPEETADGSAGDVDRQRTPSEPARRGKRFVGAKDPETVVAIHV